MELLDRIYAHGKVGFSLLWIGAYVVLTSVADALSIQLGLPKCLTLPMQVLLIAALLSWLRHAALTARLGLRAPVVPASHMLFYLPLALMLSHKVALGGF